MNEHNAQILARRALMNTKISPASIASVLNKTAVLIDTQGWQHGPCINGLPNLDICRALHHAVELSTDAHDGLWYACREALLDFINEFTVKSVNSLAAWNDKQSSPVEITQLIREAAHRVILPKAL